MRRWLWPYAVLAVVLSLFGLFAAVYALLGVGPDRAAATFASWHAVVIEPFAGFLGAMLETIAPFEVSPALKQVFVVLVLIALAGLTLALVFGLILLPVFYALYRSRGS